MKQQEAIQDVLEKASRPLTAAAIASALERGGYPFESKEPKGPVYAGLKKNLKTLYFTKRDGANVVFGLQKWEQVEGSQTTQ